MSNRPSKVAKYRLSARDMVFSKNVSTFYAEMVGIQPTYSDATRRVATNISADWDKAYSANKYAFSACPFAFIPYLCIVFLGTQTFYLLNSPTNCDLKRDIWAMPNTH